jgi:hypothetical protein
MGEKKETSTPGRWHQDPVSLYPGERDTKTTNIPVKATKPNKNHELAHT